MNLTQRQDILDLIEKLNKFDLIGFLKSQGIEDLEEYNYYDRTFSDFSFQLKRMTEQLKAEIEKKEFRYLPNSFLSQTEFGDINLTHDLGDLLTSIKAHGNEENTTRILDRLIFYQLTFGFWDRSSLKIHESKNIDTKRRLNELIILEEKYASQRETINYESQQVQELIEKLNDSLDKIEENITLISNRKNDIENIHTIINRNLEDTTTTKSRINEIETRATESFNKINSDINDYSKKFNDIINLNSTLESDLKKTDNNSKSINEKINATYTFIESKKEQIETMVGLATDGALGYKFDERQKNIFKSIRFWKNMVPISYLIAAFWVLIIFNSLKTELGNEWLNLLINLAKTTPAWFFVAFCTNQYKKEREFEEEYAFKSAVAMTITSYTSLLSNDEIDKMKTKDHVLSKVLDNLYSSPLKKEIERKTFFRTKKKVVSDMASKSKELEEILRPVIDLVKEFKK